MEREISTLTKKEIEQVRCMLALASEIPPDDIDIIDFLTDEKIACYFLDYKGYKLGLGFDSFPSFERIREELKDLYLKGVELEQDYNEPI